jgi:hypothetical protein
MEMEEDKPYPPLSEEAKAVIRAAFDEYWREREEQEYNA